jgi:L-ascorbate metabolism protein UlaG (beta-lactamase superfamily)
MFQVQTLSKQELLRTAMTATLDALRPPKRRKPPTPLLQTKSSSALQDSLLHGLAHTPHLHSPSSSLLPFSSCLSSSSATAIAPFTHAPNSISVEWIGHATMLIHLAGKWILTDPVLSERVGIEICGRVIGIERYTQPARTLETLPKPDIILLSHAHLDHTDVPTLRRFAAKYPNEIHIVTAKNTHDIIDDLAWKSVHEIDWEQELWLENIKISGLETLHNGWRLPWERDRAYGYSISGRSYNGYLIEGGGKKIVFGGDTAYTHKFSALRNRGIDIAIMPIGAYQGYETLHCTPEQALQMASEMRAEYFIPMHCSTFDQSEEEPSEPLERLYSASIRHDMTVALTTIGESFVLPRQPMEAA